MKKNSLTPFAFLLIIFFHSSCTKVIDINLNAAEPKIVIEGNISNQPNSCIIKLSKTVNFNESNTFPPVNGAIVTISDNLGNSETLTEASSGIYTSNSIQAIPGRTYSLSVTSDGKNYTSTATVPNTVSIDSLLIDSISMGFGGRKSSKFIRILYQDPFGINNYYRFIEIINGNTVNTIFINDDKLQDGSLINYRLRKGDSPLNSGDNVTILLQTIDKAVYDYFSMLQQLVGGGRGGQTATPANPKSNISGGALGYFSANSETSKTIIVQ